MFCRFTRTVLVVIISTCYVALTQRNPCKGVVCSPNEICVSVTEECQTPPCAPYSCINSTRRGTCPVQIPEVHPEFNICTDHCVHDVDCPNEDKCCRSACGAHVCVKPAQKPGTCPSLETSYIGLCVAQCRRDMDCPGAEKCCGGCPRKCVAAVNHTEICQKVACPPGYRCSLSPVICRLSPCYPIASCLIVKKDPTGRCPTSPMPQSDTCLRECQIDGNCPGEETCCDMGCHKVCRESVIPTREGNCPKSMGSALSNIISLPCKAECTVDADCPNVQKCCGDCGKCLKAVINSKPGKCPDDPFTVFPLLGIKLRCQGRQYCKTDQDCSGTMKCCGVCPRRCRAVKAPTASSKRSKCPAILHVVNCRRSRVKKCERDRDCRKSSICCLSVTCGRVCVQVLRTYRSWWLG